MRARAQSHVQSSPRGPMVIRAWQPPCPGPRLIWQPCLRPSWRPPPGRPHLCVAASPYYEEAKKRVPVGSSSLTAPSLSFYVRPASSGAGAVAVSPPLGRQQNTKGTDGQIGCTSMNGLDYCTCCAHQPAHAQLLDKLPSPCAFPVPGQIVSANGSGCRGWSVVGPV